MRTAIAVLALLGALLAGCGDTSFILIFRTGTVLTDPDCRDETGAFDFRDDSGLTLLVLIDNDTTIILANSAPGRCEDIARGASVEVQGTRSGTHLIADEVLVRS